MIDAMRVYDLQDVKYVASFVNLQTSQIYTRIAVLAIESFSASNIGDQVTLTTSGPPRILWLRSAWFVRDWRKARVRSARYRIYSSRRRENHITSMIYEDPPLGWSKIQSYVVIITWPPPLACASPRYLAIAARCAKFRCRQCKPTTQGFDFRIQELPRNPSNQKMTRFIKKSNTMLTWSTAANS